MLSERSQPNRVYDLSIKGYQRYGAFTILCFQGIVLTAEREQSAFLSIVNKAIFWIFNNPKDIFLKTKVMDLLFNGNTLNCTSKEFAVNAVCTMLRKKGLFPETEPNVFSFSVFGKVRGLCFISEQG